MSKKLNTSSSNYSSSNSTKTGGNKTKSKNNGKNEDVSTQLCLSYMRKLVNIPDSKGCLNEAKCGRIHDAKEYTDAKLRSLVNICKKDKKTASEYVESYIKSKKTI